jgi:hypothetical protein
MKQIRQLIINLNQKMKLDLMNRRTPVFLKTEFDPKNDKSLLCTRFTNLTTWSQFPLSLPYGDEYSPIFEGTRHCVERHTIAD